MKNIGKEVTVGLFATIALVLLYFGFNFLKGIDFFASRSKYYAIYDNVDPVGIVQPGLRERIRRRSGQPHQYSSKEAK